MTFDDGVRSADRDESDLPVWRTWEPGQRVMIRRLLPTDPTHKYTDVLGVIIAVTSQEIVLENRRGEAIKVPCSLIVTGKRIPPAPPRRRPRID